MDIATLEIRWHYPHDIAQENIANQEHNVLAGKDADKEGAVLSIQWHPTEMRLLTAGFDGAVKVWGFDPTVSLSSSIIHLSTMCLNERTACNVAKWSPDGTYIASAYNSGEVVIWRKHTGTAPPPGPTYEYNVEHWVYIKVLRMHAEKEVYSICFSPDMRFLFSGAFDGNIVIYDLCDKFLKAMVATTPHTAQIQGSAWDPLGAYVVTIGADRRVSVIANATESGPGSFAPHDIIEKTEKGGQLFRGDGASSFYRHGDWSPDGAFLALPCGWIAAGESHNCCYVFVRHVFQRPYRALIMDGDAAVMGAKFSPVPYSGGGGWGMADYALAIAVFSSEAVVVFTTAAATPIVRFADMHYAPLSDLSWCRDGMRIAVSSEDGSCTIMSVLLPSTAGAALIRVVAGPLDSVTSRLKTSREGLEAWVQQDRVMGSGTHTVTARKKVVAPAPPAKREREDSPHNTLPPVPPAIPTSPS